MAASIPPPRVVTTSHTPAGVSIIASDTASTMFSPFGPAGSAFSIFHSTSKVPASNLTPISSVADTSLPRAPAEGAIFCISDFPPGAKAPMHRTLSLDYGIVMTGEVVMKMDGGEETVLKAGDVLIQRGAAHSWENRGKEVCRLAAVLVASEPVVAEDGTML